MQEFVYTLTYPGGKVVRVRVSAPDINAATAWVYREVGGDGSVDIQPGTPQPGDADLPVVGPGSPGNNPQQAVPADGSLEQPDIRAAQQIDLEDELPMAAFSRGLQQRGYDTEGPLGGLLRQQYTPTRAAFTFDRYLKGTPADDNPESSFEAYSAGGPNAYANSRELFGQIAGGAPWANQEMKNALTQGGAGDTPENQAFRGEFGNLARGAARSRYGMASRYLPNDATMDRRFNQEMYTQAQRGPAAQGVNAIDFYKKYFGL